MLVYYRTFLWKSLEKFRDFDIMDISARKKVFVSDREKLYQLLDAIPDYKLSYAITYLQGLTDGGRAELNKETLEALEEA